MKMKFIWNVIKGFIINIPQVLLVFIAIALYAVLLMLSTVWFKDDTLLLFFMILGLYLIACFVIYVLLNYESFKEEHKKVEEKDSGQVIEKSYILFIKVKDDDNSYTKKEVKIDTAGKTDIDINNELRDKVFEYLSWGYKVNE